MPKTAASSPATPAAKAPAKTAVRAPTASPKAATKPSGKPGLPAAGALQRPRRKPTAMRRQPSQDRAHATIETVLKAAEAEVAHGGLDQLTTKRIAATAGLSVGAVYEYFPNKEAILGEMVTRWLTRVFLALDSVHPRHGEGLDMISYLVAQADKAAHLYEDQPGLGALLDMLNAVPALREVCSHHDARMLQSVTSALTHYAPKADPDELRDTAQSILTISHPMVTAAIVYRSGNRERLLTHLRVCLIALGSRLLTGA